jgi:REP element-mobilizing transposase RayT
MARKPRVEFEGAFYHVIARGNQRRSIFSDDRDREAYATTASTVPQDICFRGGSKRYYAIVTLISWN